MFYAPDGYNLVIADYGQIEPRILASLSQDKTMREAFLNKEDVYTAIAEPMGLDRKAGKVLLLSLMYGVGPAKVATDLHVTEDEAKDILDGFERKYKSIFSYKQAVIREATNRRPIPYATTMLGHRRYLPDLKAPERWMVARAQRQAFNHRVQGTAAHAMLVALIRADVMLEDIPDAQVILTVHDEVVTLCREEDTEEVAEIIVEAMEGAKLPCIDVPLIAEPDIGKSWAAKH